MLKRNKPIGKCTTLMAKAEIFIENLIFIRGGGGGTILSVGPPNNLLFATLAKPAPRDEKKGKLYKILPIN